MDMASLRKALGLRQIDVAAQIGVSQCAVSKWESGITTPNASHLKALAKLYSVSVSFIAFGYPAH